MVAVTDIDGADQYTRIGALLQTLPAHTGLLIWCNSKGVMSHMETWLIQNGISVTCHLLDECLPAQFRCVLLAPDGENTLMEYSHWVRDPFVWKWNEQGRLLLLGSEDAKNEDAYWGAIHLKSLKIKGFDAVSVQHKAIPVAGGNILFDEDFIMVGAQQFRDASAEIGLEEARSKLLMAMNGPNGTQFTRVIEIGAHTTQEPPKLIHLDLYMSLTGLRIKDRTQVLVGHCELVSGNEPPHPDLVAAIDGMNEYLEAVAEDLSNRQFDVIRNPIPVLQQQTTASSYLCAYNNGLTEVVTGQYAIVWLPKLTYEQESAGYFEHLERLEKKNIEIWENLGFEVRLIHANFHTILDDQGSLHCITNEIFRSA